MAILNVTIRFRPLALPKMPGPTRARLRNFGRKSLVDP
jgi:hypothetical protein